jgi:hypothetical protein
MEGLYGATRETDFPFPSWSFCTSYSELVPSLFIKHAKSISPESVPNLSPPVWQIVGDKEKF